MALVNMKQKKPSKKEMKAEGAKKEMKAEGAKKEMKAEGAKKETKAEGVSTESPDRYPYGLEIRLDSDGMKKLGLTAANYPAKTKCVIVAKGYVESVSSRQSMEGGTREDMTIQITDLEIEKVKPNKYSAYKKDQDQGYGTIES